MHAAEIEALFLLMGQLHGKALGPEAHSNYSDEFLRLRKEAGQRFLRAPEEGGGEGFRGALGGPRPAGARPPEAGGGLLVKFLPVQGGPGGGEVPKPASAAWRSPSPAPAPPARTPCCCRTATPTRPRA